MPGFGCCEWIIWMFRNVKRNEKTGARSLALDRCEWIGEASV